MHIYQPSWACMHLVPPGYAFAGAPLSGAALPVVRQSASTHNAHVACTPRPSSLVTFTRSTSGAERMAPNFAQHMHMHGEAPSEGAL